MRRPRRYILHGLTGLSLLLCVAAAALWARAQRVMDVAELRVWHGPDDPPRRTTLMFLCYRGSLELRVGRDAFYPAPPRRDEFRAARRAEPAWERSAGPPRPYADPAVPPRGWAGFGWETMDAGLPSPASYFVGPVGGRHYPMTYRVAGVAAPWWAVVAATAALPAARLARRVRRGRRAGPGHCVACGYDLRATPDRCPECGAVPAGVAR